MILLQVDPAFGDKLETVHKSFYEIEDALILHGLPFLALDTIIGYVVWFIDCLLTTKQINSIRTIRRILNFF